MSDRKTHCTVNLDIWYTINECYRPYYILLDQFYDYISYSIHKRYQLSNRLAITRNKIQCKSNTNELFISSQYAKQPKGTVLRLRDGTVITIAQEIMPESFLEKVSLSLRRQITCPQSCWLVFHLCRSFCPPLFVSFPEDDQILDTP